MGGIGGCAWSLQSDQHTITSNATLDGAYKASTTEATKATITATPGSTLKETTKGTTPGSTTKEITTDGSTKETTTTGTTTGPTGTIIIIIYIH